jgi:hypothetical protein
MEAEMGIRRMRVPVASAFCTIAISHGAAGATVGKLSQNDAAVLDLDRLRTHPLGHKALQVGIDRSVLDGHRIEGRLCIREVLIVRGDEPLTRRSALTKRQGEES